jgi:hypothetical protein
MSDVRAEKLARALRARVSMSHPGLLPARVVRDGAGRFRILLQRHDAPTLAELLPAGEISRKDGVRLVYGVASAAEALRRAGLVARDLRPGRILVSSERGVVLADTGIPLELMPRTLRTGDPEAAFRSPEERAGDPIDARSNVYSLGVLLRAVLDRPVSSGLPKQVEAVIAQATAADPAERYAGPKEFIVAAAGALGVRIRQRPGGGTELVRVAAEGVAASAQAPAPPKPSRPTPPRRPPRAPSAPGPPHREPAPEPSRSRGPAFAPPSLPRPSVRRPSIPRLHLRLPSIPRPHLRLPSVRWPRPRLPRPQLRMPAVPGLRVPSQPSVRALGVAAALATCVIGGLLLARLVGDEEGGTQISSSALSVRLPEGWDSTKVARESSIALSAPVAAAPLGESGTGLVAGRVEDAAELDERLSAEATQRAEITLGRLQAWRYSGLEPERGLAAVAYLAPTSDGSLLVICHARRPVAPARLKECERIASTIALRGARPAALASDGAPARAVSEVMTELRSARQVRRRELAKARRAPEQARAARALAESYRDAADRLEASPVIEDGVAGGLAESLRAAASAYGELAAAAKDRDRTDYRAATRVIVRREAAVERGAAESLSA